MAEKEEMIFEGIGNELIWTCGFLLATGIALFVFLLRQEGNMQEIHPEQVNIITCMDKHYYSCDNLYVQLLLFTLYDIYTFNFTI